MANSIPPFPPQRRLRPEHADEVAAIVREANAYAVVRERCESCPTILARGEDYIVVLPHKVGSS
jgi:hypothetical protein